MSCTLINTKHLLTIGVAALFCTSCQRQPAASTSYADYHYIDSIVHSYHDPDSLKSIIAAYQKTKNMLGVAVGQRTLGKYYRDNSLFEKAIGCHRQSIAAAEQIADTAELIRCLNDLATDYRRVGILDLASEEHFRALDLCMQQSDKTSDVALKNYTMSLNGLGNVYLQLGNNEVADSVFRVSLSVEKRLGSDLGQAINLANIGAVFENIGQNDSALVYYQQSYEKNKAAGSTLGMALCHDHMGDLYEKQQQYPRAVNEYLTAYDLLEANHDVWHWLEPCLSLANIHIREGNTDRALWYLNTALRQATDISSKEHLAQIHHLYYTIYERQGRTAEAFEHYKLSDAYNDSIYNAQILNQVQNVRIKIERQRVSDQLQLARDDARQERTLKIFAFSLLGAFFIIAALIFGGMGIFIRSRSRERKLMSKLQTSREQFFTNITHEFRTPLTVILGIADHIIGDPTMTREKLVNDTTVISRQGNKLLALINQLLDISKIKSTIGNADWQQGNIVAFIRMCMETFRPYAQEKRIELIYTPDQNMVTMDFVPDYMCKILDNLISNSIKFTNGLGRIHVKTSCPTDNQLCLVVSDNGVGIPPEALEHIFEPFFQSDGDSQQIGTGIGLSLVHQIVEAMKGSIHCDSVSGKGTTMTVLLPLRHSEEQLKFFNYDEWHRKKRALACPDDFVGHDDTPVPEADADDAEGSGHTRILIIEDNNDVAYYIGEQLQDSHTSVFYAKDGDEGIAKARDIMPDLIITDLMMPGTDGLQVCRLVRSSDLLNHIPIIIITAKATEEDRIAGLEAGADAYLVKPFNADVLHVRITKLLEQRRLLREKFSKELLEGKAPEAELKPSDRDFLIKLKEVVSMQMQNNQVDVESIASQMYVSRAQLNRKVQAITGQSTSAYVTQLRMNYAKRLLAADPTITISEVALKCGYEDMAYFSRAFKQATGQTPTLYRKTC